MSGELSMLSRAEVTAKYARADAKAVKKDKGRVLDQVVGVTGWSWDNARRRHAGRLGCLIITQGSTVRPRR